MSENIKEIIEKIEYNDGLFTKEELQILLDNKEVATPILLDTIRNPEEIIDKVLSNEDYLLPVIAMLILAQFRELQAYPLVCELFSGNAKKVDDALGDFVVEDLSNVLASVSGGDTSLIKQLVEDEKVYDFVRSAAIDSWLCLFKANLKTREEVITYYKTLFEKPCEEEDFIRGAVVYACLKLKATELMPEIEKSYAEDKIELGLMGDWEEFQKEMTIEKRRIPNGLIEGFDLIDDAIPLLESWYLFNEPVETMQKADYETQEIVADKDLLWESHNYGIFVRETPKVGNNEPCPCGSGRKYKKCCINL